MAQLYNELALETCFNEHINVGCVPDSGPSEGDTITGAGKFSQPHLLSLTGKYFWSILSAQSLYLSTIR